MSPYNPQTDEITQLYLNDHEKFMQKIQDSPIREQVGRMSKQDIMKIIAPLERNHEIDAWLEKNYQDLMIGVLKTKKQ